MYVCVYSVTNIVERATQMHLLTGYKLKGYINKYLFQDLNFGL